MASVEEKVEEYLKTKLDSLKIRHYIVKYKDKVIETTKKVVGE